MPACRFRLPLPSPSLPGLRPILLLLAPRSQPLSSGARSPVKLLRNLDLASFFKLTTREHFDRITPLCMLALSLIGVVFIYSAQFARGGGQWEQQLVYLTLGGAIYLATSFMDYRIWLRYAHWVYL